MEKQRKNLECLIGDNDCTICERSDYESILKQSMKLDKLIVKQMKKQLN